MKFDIFLSLCQTEVDGYMPNERQMFLNFFDQVKLADDLGFGTAWIAETHLSCEIQKQNKGAVIPHFKGEIGLNTDILQMAHQVFAKTKRIHIGSAVRNIICNGGPIAHAEAVKTFLTLHGLNLDESRKIHIGFAAGRFPFSNTAYGFVPKSPLELAAWDVIKGKYFQQAAEIFVRLLKGEQLSSADLSVRKISRKDFRSDADWEKAQAVHGGKWDEIPLSPHWEFEKVGVIPFEANLKLLDLTIGSHDPEAQILVNEHLPVGVFNLSITPPEVIEQTHARMQKAYHPSGGPWSRGKMPRTLMLFLDDTPGISDAKKTERAKAQAEKAWRNYWLAMEGTLDNKKVEMAVGNTVAGHPAEVVEQIRQKYHADDRLMLWFDFNNHDNEGIKNSMRAFMEKVVPQLENR